MNAQTEIEVEISDVIDSDTTPVGAFVHATVTANVRGGEGKVAVPAGSSCVVMIVASDKKGGDTSMALALYQLSIANRSYLLLRGNKQLATLEFHESASKGEGHRSVHLQRLSRHRFTLSEAVALKH